MGFGSVNGRSFAAGFAAVGLLALLALLAGTAGAATLCVGTAQGCDEQFDTAAQAFDAAASGDTVVLRGLALDGLALPDGASGLTVDARLNQWSVRGWRDVLGAVDAGEGNTVLALPFTASLGAAEPPMPVVVGAHTHSTDPATCNAHPDAEWDPGSATCLFLTVQAAIDFAHPGSTVVVPASADPVDPTPRFEQLLVFENKFHTPAQLLTGLRLCSSPSTGPPAAPADACSAPDLNAIIDGSDTAFNVIDVRAPDVVVKGLTVQHPRPSVASGAIRVAAAGVQVLGNQLRGEATLADALLGITLDGEFGILVHTDAADVRIEGNRILNWEHSGIYVHQNAIGPTTIVNNILQGNARSGIRVANDAAADAVTIEGNTIGPNGLRGVLVDGAPGTVIRNNAITLDMPWTLDPRSGAGVVVDGGVGVRILDNVFTGSTLNAVALDRLGWPDQPEVVLRGNVFRLSGLDTVGLAFTEAVEDRVVDARGNDWGMLGRVPIANLRIRDDDGSNRVRYVPYLDQQGGYHPPRPSLQCFKVTAVPASIQLVQVATPLDLQDALDAALPAEPACRASLGRIVGVFADFESYDGATASVPALVRHQGMGQARLLARGDVATPQWAAGPALTFLAGSEGSTLTVPETGNPFVVTTGLQGTQVDLEDGAGVIGEGLDPAMGLVNIGLNRFVPVPDASGPGALARDGGGLAVIANHFLGLDDPVRFAGTEGGIVRSNAITMHGDHGIALSDSSGALVQANDISLDRSVVGFGGTVDGIRVSGGEGVRVHLNDVSLDSHPGSSGVRIGDGAGHEVVANTLQRNAIGVYVKDMDGALVQGNTVSDGLSQGMLLTLLDSDPTTSIGAYVGGGSGVQVRNNAFTDVGDGVRLFEGSGQVLEGNDYTDVGTAVRFLGATDSTASHENVQGAGTAAAWAAGSQPTDDVFTLSCVRDTEVFVHLASGVSGVTADARSNDWGVYTVSEVAAGMVDEGAGNTILSSPFLADDCVSALLGPLADFARSPPDPVYAVVDTLAFMDTSTPGSTPIVSWAWDFGDGATSTAQHPTHVYAAPGTYTVTLTVEDETELASSKSADIDVLTWLPPLAGFTAAPNPTDRLTPVQFTDASVSGTGAIVERLWTFGDGDSSTDLDPLHTYADVGTFTATLTVTDEKGQSGSESLDMVVVNLPPVAAGRSDRVLTDRLTAVQFTDASTDPDGTIERWLWDFGDGATSTAQNPSQTYASLGTFTPTLTVTDNDGGSASFTLPDITVVNLPPVAAGSSDRVLTDRITAVRFTDASTDLDGTIAAWRWDFGDGATSTDQDPSHTYATLGTFTPTLTVADNDGASASFTLPDITVVNLPPTAAFSFAPAPSNRVDPTAFTDLSADLDGGVTTWSWAFGDGSASTAQHPSHTYGSLGLFTATLTVEDADGGSAVATAVVQVVNLVPSLSFTVDPEWPNILQPVFFDETSSDRDGSVVSWAWEFGDGATSSFPDAVHVYLNGGRFDVNLTIEDDDGAVVRMTKTIFVCAPGADLQGLLELQHIRLEVELCLRLRNLIDLSEVPILNAIPIP